MAISSTDIVKEGILDTENDQVRIESVAEVGSFTVVIPQHDLTSRMASAGVPFAVSDVSNTADIVLKDNNGAQVPAQFDITTRYLDNSIRTVQVTAVVSGYSTQDVNYTVEYGGDPQSAYTTDLTIVDNANDYTISNGNIRVVFDKTTGTIATVHGDTAGDDSYSQEMVGANVHYECECALTDNIYSTEYADAPTISVSSNGIKKFEIEVDHRLKTSGGVEGPALYSIYTFYDSINSSTESSIDVQHSIIDDADETVGNSTNFWGGDLQGKTVAWALRRIEVNVPVNASMDQLIMAGEDSDGSGSLDLTIDRTSSTAPKIRQTGERLFNQYATLSSDPNQLFSNTIRGSDGTGVSETFTGALSGSRCRGYTQLGDNNYSLCVMPMRFWQKYPQSIESNQSGIKYKMYDQVDSPTHETNYKLDDGHFRRPQTLSYPVHGTASTYSYKLVFNQSSKTTNQRLEDIYDVYHDYTPQIRASYDHYCDSGAFWEMSKSNGTTSYYDETVLTNRLRHARRPVVDGGTPEHQQMYGVRDYGDRSRPDQSASAANGYKIPLYYNGTHIGGNNFIAQWMRTGEYEWLDTGAKETEWFCDWGPRHSETYSVGPLNLLPQPVPKGYMCFPKHAITDHYGNLHHEGHFHCSGASFMYMLTGNRYYYRVMQNIATWLEWFVPPRYPLAFPSTIAKIGTPNSRPSVEALRDHGYTLYMSLEWVRISNDQNHWINVCKHTMDFWLIWWKDVADHIQDFNVAGVNDYTQGTGYWESTIPGGMDNAADNSFNGSTPWMDSSMIAATIMYLEFDEISPSGVDRSECKMMLYQVMKYIISFCYVESEQSFVYSESYQPPFDTDVEKNMDSARLLTGSFCKLLIWMSQDIATGVMDTTEQAWFDPTYYQTVISRYVEDWKVTAQRLDSFAPYGYELPWPNFLSKYYNQAMAIEF